MTPSVPSIQLPCGRPAINSMSSATQTPAHARAGLSTLATEGIDVRHDLTV